MEEEDIEEEKDVVQLRDIVPEAQPLVQPDQALYHPPDSSPTQNFEDLNLGLCQVTLKYMSQSRCPMGENSMVLRILGFLTDMATGNKVQTLAYFHPMLSRKIRTRFFKQVSRHLVIWLRW